MAAPKCDVDDGWDAERESRPRGDRDVTALVDLIREALTILDGTPPKQVQLAGEGWSLVGPRGVRDVQDDGRDSESTRMLRRKG